jgi:hypothetical protein
MKSPYPAPRICSRLERVGNPWADAGRHGMSLIYALGFFGLSEFEPGKSAECHVQLSFLCAANSHFHFDSSFLHRETIFSSHRGTL